MRAYSWASVAELVDALDSKSSAVRRAGSIPAGGTKPKNYTVGLKLKTRILTEESGFFVVGLGLIGTWLVNAGSVIFGGIAAQNHLPHKLLPSSCPAHVRGSTVLWLVG